MDPILEARIISLSATILTKKMNVEELADVVRLCILAGDTLVIEKHFRAVGAVFKLRLP